MNKILRISFKLLIIIIISCKENRTESIPIIEIEKNIDNFKLFKLGDFDYKLDYIVLESTPDAMLMDIRFIDISGDYIVVSDRDKCLLFDRSGKFISKIGSQGRGPGENIAFTQVKIYNEKIFLPDGLSNVMNIFNVYGEFINTLKSPGDFWVLNSNSWMPVTDSTFLVHVPNHTGNEGSRVVLIDNNGDILQKYANTTFYTNVRDHCIYQRPATFFKHNDNIYFKQLLNDTIYQLNNDHLYPIYLFDLGAYGFSFEYYALPWELFREKLADGITIEYLFETRDYIFVIMNFWRNYPFAFYRKNYHRPSGLDQYMIIGLFNKPNDEFFLVAPSNVDHQIEPTGIKNDIDGGINFMPRYAVNDTLIVSWFEAYELKMYVASEAFKNSTPKYPEKKKELEKLAASLDENDNPVLMLVKLKE
ncbi:MAG: 6-bladed beta-propeller [Marinilabiliales bacterium]|nr:MAG: 6-bladed beta-propeller [Marinilabiliales bacterium]